MDLTPEFQFIYSYYMKEQYDTSGKRPIKKNEDAIVIVYKENGKKKMQVIDAPKFTFHVSKHDRLLDRYQDNRRKEDVDEITIAYHDLAKFLAEYSNRSEDYFNIRRTEYPTWEKRRAAQNAFLDRCMLDPNIFGADVNIEDFYKMEFVKKYGVKIGGYTKGFFDIEVGGASSYETANDPVTVISYYDSVSDTMHVSILDTPEYPGLQEFKQRLDSGEFLAMLKNDNEMNGRFEFDINPKKPAKLTNVNTNYIFRFFKDELDLLIHHYSIINETTPDFVLAFNFSYDNNYVINRLVRLLDVRKTTLKLKDIVFHRDVPWHLRQWGFREDRSPKAQFYNKWHHFYIVGYTAYMCSMALYAYIRKAKGVLPSYALNDVALGELGKGKHDYSEIADSPLDLPYKDYTAYIFYNIKDTWLLAEMEAKNHDVEAIMYQGEYTRLPMVTKPTATLKNALQLSYESQGLVIANNRNVIVNRGKDSEEKEYEGAIVAEPRLNKAIATPLFPYPSRVIRPFVIDLDLASMYPSNALAYNIYKTSLLFEVKKIGSVTGGPEPQGGVINIPECFDNWCTDSPMSWGHDYLQLPSLVELIGEMRNELDSISTNGGINGKT